MSLPGSSVWTAPNFVASASSSLGREATRRTPRAHLQCDDPDPISEEQIPFLDATEEAQSGPGWSSPPGTRSHRKLAESNIETANSTRQARAAVVRHEMEENCSRTSSPTIGLQLYPRLDFSNTENSGLVDSLEENLNQRRQEDQRTDVQFQVTQQSRRGLPPGLGAAQDAISPRPTSQHGPSHLNRHGMHHPEEAPRARLSRRYTFDSAAGQSALPTLDRMHDFFPRLCEDDELSPLPSQRTQEELTTKKPASRAFSLDSHLSKPPSVDGLQQKLVSGQRQPTERMMRARAAAATRNTEERQNTTLSSSVEMSITAIK
ncbi:hypothetical protein CYMTET_39087 [Cymbomonas tetramitiformis]|uniref:Uncharacterized protein n=1 Tax=Cymbomonas tetramitiformis TaxID=36881 RepID=A0AAE0CBW1_9CHLO|nr:hypothetical protein CYMTET_39087 [Cymbomonas tetramitiformis]